MSENTRSSERRNGDRRSEYNRKVHRRRKNIPVDRDNRTGIDKRKEYQRKSSRRDGEERRD